MRKSSVPTFIDKTWSMLEDSSHSQVIRWLPHGSSFEILDEAAFSRELLPIFFKHSNFSSFIRQVPSPRSS